MTSSFQLLGVDLIKDSKKLNEIDHWLRVMNRPQGWHYDLDIIWLLQELEKAGIKKGDTVLDAGAGLGVTQFILASRGYNVISLDFSQRTIPQLADGIFDIQTAKQGNLNYKHDYIGFVDYGTEVVVNNWNKTNVMAKALKTVFNKGFFYIWSLIKSNLRTQRNKKWHANELNADHSDFGSIKFVRAAFHDIPLEDMQVDALVSVSAIEHADKTIMDKNISEMIRVVKNGAPILITTSATNQLEDIFHDKTKGWCFSQGNLKKMIAAEDPQSFEYEKTEKELLDTKEWVSRIDPYYTTDPESEFYKRKMKKLPYLVIGLKIIK